MTGDNYKRILRLAGCGTFIGSLSGPPCETFSPARHMPKPDNFPGRWPRPLRSMLRPWGLSALSQGELEQLRVGSQLYINSALVEFEVVHNGGYSLLEHPADHSVKPTIIRAMGGDRPRPSMNLLEFPGPHLAKAEETFLLVWTKMDPLKRRRQRSTRGA